MNNEKPENIIVAKKLETKQAPQSNNGPGARLRKAREAKGMSMEDIVRKLCLTTPVVQQIENDDYRDVQAVTFMRGYLRSYARVVELDADALITEFNSLGLVDAPPLMSTQRIYHREISVIGRAVSWIGAIAGVCVLLLIVSWIHSEFSNNTAISNVASNIASTVESSVAENKPAPTAINQTNSMTSATVKNSPTVLIPGNLSEMSVADNQTSVAVPASSSAADTDTANNQNIADANSTNNNNPNATTTANSDAATAKKGKQIKTASQKTKHTQSESSTMINYNQDTVQDQSPVAVEKKPKMAMPF